MTGVASNDDLLPAYGAHFLQSWSSVSARIEALLRESSKGPHDAANRQGPHLPRWYDAGRPRSVSRFRISQPRTASLSCPAGLRARRPSPMIDLYLKNAFSTRA